MGKKTLGKKGCKREKGDNGEANAMEEDFDKAFPIGVNGDKLSSKGEKKNKKRHEVNDNDVELTARQSDAAIEGVVDVVDNKKEKEQRKKRKIELDDDGKESLKAKKKQKTVNNHREIKQVKESSNDVHSNEEGNLRLEKDEGKDLGNKFEFEVRKDRKKRHKENKNKDGSVADHSVIEYLEDNETGTFKGQQILGREEAAETRHGEEGDQKKKKRKKHKSDKKGGFVAVMNNITEGKEASNERVQLDGLVVEEVEDSRKEREKKKKKQNYDLEAEKPRNKSVNKDKEILDDGGDACSAGNEVGGRNIEVRAVNVEDGKKDKKKKKVKSVMKSGLEGTNHKGVPRTKKSMKASDSSENPIPKKRSKKVSFSDHVEVFPSSDGLSNLKKDQDGLVRGKRFSREEDEMIMEAVSNYIEAHGLGEEGIDMVLHCKSHPEIKNCWKEIGEALPWRPYVSIYYRAHTLFERDEKRRWTTEEVELVRKFHEKHGSDWKTLADALGKHRIHVKDTWRRIRLPNLKRGCWSQEEYQTLFDLVNMDLRMKAFEEKKNKHGMLRDNIPWEAISEKLSTRNNSICCLKWYNQLTSAMVAEGDWANADDYRMLDALLSLDACCFEDVDWDNLLEHRSGDVCRKRWSQMVLHIGEHGTKSFAEQVEVLSKRYCPELLEAREAYDNKPAVS